MHDSHPVTLIPHFLALPIPESLGPSDLVNRIQAEGVEVDRDEIDFPRGTTALIIVRLHISWQWEIFRGGGDDEKLLSSVIRCEADYAKDILASVFIR